MNNSMQLGDKSPLALYASSVSSALQAGYDARTVIDITILDPESPQRECRATIANIPGAGKSRAAARESCLGMAAMIYSMNVDTGRQQLELCHDSAGAPWIRSNGIRCTQKVSVSHSGDWVAVALSNYADVGIDVEIIDRKRQTEKLGAYLGWQGGLADPLEFYSRWTLWEACFKAVKGVSLSECKDAFETLVDSVGAGTMSQAMEWAAFQGRWEGAISYTLVTYDAEPSDVTKSFIVSGKEYL